MTGHSVALFLTDCLEAAVDDLIKLESETLEDLLTRLQKEEDDHYNNKVLPGDIQNFPEEVFVDGKDKNADEIIKQSGLDLSVFFKGKSFCHSARLPSRIRYLGYLTETDKVGGPAPFGKEEYDIGIELQKAMEEYKSDIIPLVWEKDKWDVESCPVTVSPDRKDFFFSKGDRWNTLIIPNKTEKKVYLNDGATSLQGLVFPFMRQCDWNNCEDGYMSNKDLNDGKWEMKINGEMVTNLIPVHGGDHGSYICKHANGYYFPPDSDGNFKIEIRTKEPSSFVKLSSIVIF
jgi:hypothetical protein